MHRNERRAMVARPVRASSPDASAMVKFASICSCKLLDAAGASDGATAPALDEPQPMAVAGLAAHETEASKSSLRLDLLPCVH